MTRHAGVPRCNLALVEGGNLPAYPFDECERLESHSWMKWERRRWLNSSMNLLATDECAMLFCNLTWISFEQSPIGTLPNDLNLLARLLRRDAARLGELVRMEYGPLHKWTPCLCANGEIRLIHPVVMETLGDAVSRKEHNRAVNEAANSKKRRQRLRSVMASYNAALAGNDGAVLWIDEWFEKKGGPRRTSSLIEQAIAEWNERLLGRGHWSSKTPL